MNSSRLPSTDFSPAPVTPEQLTEAFRSLGLKEGNAVVMHSSLTRIGAVDGGAAMVLHRLLGVLGKKGTLLMPAFTSITRHSTLHDNFTKTGCWCQGKEDRHLPFISELQPDKEIGEIAHRLCSWPASTRSRHPAFSFVAVGSNSESLVRSDSLTEPFQPLKRFLEQDPFVLTIGAEMNSVTAIHLAEARRLPSKFRKERALTVGSQGLVWVEVVAPGCSAGFQSLRNRIQPDDNHETEIGSTTATLYRMRTLVTEAERLLGDDPNALSCGRRECLSCGARPLTVGLVK
jgi:aminoglycoside 3-N-acetyltransferase